MTASSPNWFAAIGAFESYADKKHARLYDRIILLETIPIAFVQTDESRATMLARVDGIRRVQPISKLRLKIIFGLERLLYDGSRAFNQLQPNGWAYEVPGLPNDPNSDNKIPYYPDFALVEGKFRSVLDLTTVLQTRLGFMAAISLSLAALPNEVFDPDDAINVATRAASRFVPIVIAAGNFHHSSAGQAGSMSAWAVAPWVISVGATDSENGGKLAPASSRGSAERPFSGPTVVAWGRSLAFPSDPKLATSFATPRIAIAMCWLAAYCLTLRYFVQVCLGTGQRQLEGIPLTGYGVIDDSCDDAAWERPQKLPALPRRGINTASLSVVLKLAQSLSTKLQVWPTPEVLRSMLLACAQQLSGFRDYETGYGFVSSESVAQYLRDFTGADFVRLFCPEKQCAEDLECQLRRIQLTDSQYLPSLLSIWEESRRRWFFPIVDDRITINKESRRKWPFSTVQSRTTIKGPAETTLDAILDTTADFKPQSFSEKVVLVHP